MASKAIAVALLQLIDIVIEIGKGNRAKLDHHEIGNWCEQIWKQIPDWMGVLVYDDPASRGYVQHDGAICPYCNSDHIQQMGIEPYNSHEVSGNVACSACRRQWTEVYALVGVCLDHEN